MLLALNCATQERVLSIKADCCEGSGVKNKNFIKT